MYWHKLIETYDNTKGICPVAHTMITVHIGILIDKNGNFLCAKDCRSLGELTPVPCTVKSEVRTNNIAPHLISDNYSYLGNIANKEKHKAYLKQLEDYIRDCEDVYAKAVYDYVTKGTLEEDLEKISINYLPNTNITFAVKGIDYINKWTDYYIQQLPKIDICCITGELDYIPEAYPSRILSPSGKEKLFMKGCGAGYISSQKIIHTLQFLNYIEVKNERHIY